MRTTLFGLWMLACNGGPGGTDPGDACDPDPCANTPGTACVDGECVDTEIVLDGAGAVFSGTWTPAADGGVVTRFEVAVGESSTKASLETDTLRVDVSLGTDESLSVSWDGVAVDGLGALTTDEAAAVQALRFSDLMVGLGRVPLKLGCADADLDPTAVAALLAPWQLLLKYGFTDRLGVTREVAAASGCAYFAEDGGRAPNGLVKLDHESLIPLVFGTFPFDDVGEAFGEESVRSAGDPLAACNALCRGACGGDCQPVNCDQEVTEVCDLDLNGVNNGYSIAALKHTCGTAAGCRAHDDCYDTCNSQTGCGTWDAAVCRRGCDDEAIGIYGFENCQAWAMGLGPFDGSLTFTYPNVGGAARQNLATCPVPAGVLQWEDPPAGGKVTFTDAAAYCDSLVLNGHDDWRVPTLGELTGLERGCPVNDCSAVDSCTGCAYLSGPAESGCYWDNRTGGECAATWSSDTFAYQGGMRWIEMFFTGGAAIGHEEIPMTVRCVRGGI